MAFNIISCCLSFIDFIIFAVGISYFKSLEHATCQFYWWSHSYDVTCKSNKEKWRTGVALFTLLLLLMLAEFVIALTASIYCCKAGCTGCCDPASPGVSTSSFFNYTDHFASQKCWCMMANFQSFDSSDLSHETCKLLAMDYHNFLHFDNYLTGALWPMSSKVVQSGELFLVCSSFFSRSLVSSKLRSIMVHGWAFTRGEMQVVTDLNLG